MEQVNSFWPKIPNPFLLCLLPLLLPLVCFVLKKPRGPKKLPPSPAKLPIIGNLHQLGTLPHRSLRDLAAKHGPLMLVHFGSTPYLVVSSADVVEEITKNHDVGFANRFTTTAIRPFVESGKDLVMHPYGDNWRLARKVSVLHLLSHNVVNGLQTLRDEEVSTMLETVRLSCLRGSEIDLRDLFISVVSNVVYRSFTGRRCEEMFNGMNFGEWNFKFKKLLGAFCFADLFPSLRWMDRLTGFTADVKRTFKELDGFMDHLIDASNTANGDFGQRSFVEILLKLEEDEKMNDLALNDIKAHMQSLFLAAIETVSSLMEWIMAELVKHPGRMKIAQDEVRRVVGVKSKISSGDIDQMHYLKCVVKETMRLHPSAVIPRETTETVKIYGYEIPPKTKVMVNLWAIQRDPKFWENPEEFLPERFTNTTQSDLRGQQKGFAPFGFGRRNCPGASYALALLDNVVANLLHWYDWELPGGSRPEDLDMSETFQITVLKKHTLRLVPLPPKPTNR